MSSERLEVVRRLCEAWCGFVADEIVAFYSLDAEIVSPTGEMLGRIYRGHGGLRRYISEFAAAFESPSFEVEEVIDAGGCVVEIVQVSGRGRHSGAEVRRRIAGVYSFRAGSSSSTRSILADMRLSPPRGCHFVRRDSRGQARQRRPKRGWSVARRS